MPVNGGSASNHHNPCRPQPRERGKVFFRISVRVHFRELAQSGFLFVLAAEILMNFSFQLDFSSLVLPSSLYLFFVAMGVAPKTKSPKRPIPPLAHREIEPKIHS